MTDLTEHRTKLRALVWHLTDVLGTTLKLLKLPLSLFLALLGVTLLGICTVNTVRDAVQAGIQGVGFCNIPVVASLSWCGGTAPIVVVEQRSLERADFPNLVRIQDVALDHLMARSAGGTAIALNVKHAELAVKDLVGIVRASNLTMKAVLADALENFASDAQTAGRGLQRLSAKMRVAIDSIVSFNAHALRAIAAAQGKSAEDVDKTLRRTFQASMDNLASHITRVIAEATTTMADLDRLEDRLFDIRSLCVTEAFDTDIELEDLLWKIWTILGGNQEKLRDLRHRASVLKEVERYRAVALAYVSAAAQTLLCLEAELSELRDRLTRMAVDERDMPLEVHLASIERSVRRMEDATRSRDHVTDSLRSSPALP